MELLFLLCFSLHNLEEALWLPSWSKYAGKYHKAVGENEFRFAVIVITAAGYLFTFQYFIFSSTIISKYIYCGFILMMVVNVFFPHLIAVIMLKRYAPGTVTGVLLNLPVGVYILTKEITNIKELGGAVSAFLVISTVILVLLRYLFAAGEKIFSDHQ